MPRLHGWKEIATYLGRSVRTVQRWEQDSDLPVLRSGREGEVIWAESEEIDGWLRRSSVAPETQQPPAIADSDPSVDRRRFRPRLAALLVASVACLALTALVLSPTFSSEPENPARWRTSPGTFEALSSTGDLLWSRHFNGTVPAEGPGETLNVPGTAVLLDDLDGDGLNEVLIAIGDPRGGTANALHILSSKGTDLVQPISRNGTATFGANLWAGPWTPHRLWILRDEDQKPTIYASFIHLSMFPTMLLEIGVDGKERGRDWSNGYVTDVAYAAFRGKPVVLVGATNNDTRGASLAIFERGRLRGAAPAINDDYRCHSCGDELPMEFLIFPRRCIARAVDGQAEVRRARVDEAGQLFVYVREHSHPTRQDSGVWYTLAQAMTIKEALITSGMLSEHRDLHAAGLLDHALSRQDELDIFPVLRWDGSRFEPLLPGPITRQGS